MPTLFLAAFTTSLVGLIVSLRLPQTLSKFFRRKIPRLIQVAFFAGLLYMSFSFARNYTPEPEDPPIRTTPHSDDGIIVMKTFS